WTEMPRRLNAVRHRVEEGFSGRRARGFPDLRFGPENRCRKWLAERVGFEPTLRLPVNTLSKRAPSTARPPLRRIREKSAGTIVGGACCATCLAPHRHWCGRAARLNTASRRVDARAPCGQMARRPFFCERARSGEASLKC